MDTARSQAVPENAPSRRRRRRDPAALATGDVAATRGPSQARQDGFCDKDGCDFAPYRLGSEDFYGEGSSFTIDSSKPFTVVTQFLTDDGTDDGDLSEIKRYFVQDDVVYSDPSITVNGKTHASPSGGVGSCLRGIFASPLRRRRDASRGRCQ